MRSLKRVLNEDISIDKKTNTALKVKNDYPLYLEIDMPYYI